MPVWAVTLLISLAKAALPLALQILQKSGQINAAEALGVKMGTHVLTAVENVKTYDTYPPDKITDVVSG